MKIGMRNVKTALAVFLCIVLFQLFNMGSPFYAAIAAIISMQSSVMDSFKTGKNRILGTFLGAFIGLIFALIGPSNPLLIGIGIIIIISISIEPSNEASEEHTIVYNYHLAKILGYYSLIDSIVKKNNW